MSSEPSGHIHGVLPLGQLIANGGTNLRSSGLGSLGILPDELIVEVLSCLAAADLVRLSAACRCTYVFSNHEDLWKALTMLELEGHYEFQGTWKDTYLFMRGLGTTKRLRVKPASSTTDSDITSVRKERRIHVDSFYSDILYQAHNCAVHPVLEHWVTRHGARAVHRRKGLHHAAFHADFEAVNQPVVLEGCAEMQSACSKWTRTYLARKMRRRSVIAGDMEMKFEDYMTYMDRQEDDMPLYLFDKDFADVCPDLAGDYEVPSIFQEDLFGLMGSERPDYRWLIIGPARSGSSFHIDPNATSAWNATICGRKKWVLFPPGACPPGVIASADGATVATPVSIVEWFMNFYDACREADTPPLECVTGPGDVIFVPRGWWHCVLNLDDFNVAITQNFVSQVNLPHVLHVLESENRELVSGCDDRDALSSRFVNALRTSRPELLTKWEDGKAERAAELRARQRLAGMFGDKQTHVVQTKRAGKASAKEEVKSGVEDEQAYVEGGKPSAAAGGFSFSFNL